MDYINRIEEFMRNEIENKTSEEIREKYLNSPIIFYVLNIEKDETYMIYYNEGHLVEEMSLITPLGVDYVFRIMEIIANKRMRIKLSKEEIKEVILNNSHLYIGGRTINMQSCYEDVCTLYFNLLRDLFLENFNVSKEVKFQTI